MKARQSPAAWARSVRQAYALTATEAALVDLAERALTVAQDGAARPEVRLAAMGRYQALVRQLDLEEVTDGKAEAPAPADVRSWPRRVS